MGDGGMSAAHHRQAGPGARIAVARAGPNGRIAAEDETRPCLAVVGGGHPAIPHLAKRLRRAPPPLHIWGGVLRRLLSI